MKRKKFIKEIISDLPFKLGVASLAIIIGVAENVIITSASILEGPTKLRKKLNRLAEIKSFSEYYEELSNLRENRFRTALWRLQEKGLVEKKKGTLHLTSLGLKYFNKIKAFGDRRKKWDGKWRILMFDIPERIKKERHWLRSELYALGYKPLQKSVFIGKFPLKEDLFKEITRRRLNNYINLITVGEIDDEEILSSFE